jgi:hypothetical protein
LKFFSPEYRQKLSEAAKRRKVQGMKGKFHSLETRYKMCRAKSGRARSEETKRKISETIRNKKMRAVKENSNMLEKACKEIIMEHKKGKKLPDDKWGKTYEELNIGAVLKTEPQEYNKPKDGKKPLIRFPVHGILRWT